MEKEKGEFSLLENSCSLLINGGDGVDRLIFQF